MRSFDLRSGEVALLRRALMIYSQDQLASLRQELTKIRGRDEYKIKEHREAIAASDKLAEKLLKGPAPDRHGLLERIYSNLPPKTAREVMGSETWFALEAYIHSLNEKE